MPNLRRFIADDVEGCREVKRVWLDGSPITNICTEFEGSPEQGKTVQGEATVVITGKCDGREFILADMNGNVRTVTLQGAVRWEAKAVTNGDQSAPNGDRSGR